MTVELILGDCLEVMKDMPDKSVDAVITDPAYESMMKWRGVGTTARMGMGATGTGSDNLDDKWFGVMSNDDLPDLVQGIHRIMKDERHAYIMCDFETLRYLYYFAVAENVFKKQKVSGVTLDPCKPLIWDKVIAGTGYTYRTVYEFIFMLWKGKKRRLNDLSIKDIIRVKKPWGSDRIFPTQKPVELMRTLILQSTEPNETVIDMFMGSGTTGVACVQTGRNFIGIEIDPDYFAIAERRIKEAQMQPRLEFEK